MFNKPQPLKADPNLLSPQAIHTLPAPLPYACQTRPVTLPSLLDTSGVRLCAKQYTWIVLANSHCYDCLTTGKFHEGQDFCLLHSPLLPRFLEHEFTHNTCSINICWMNEYIFYGWGNWGWERQSRLPNVTVTIWWNQDSNSSLTDATLTTLPHLLKWDSGDYVRQGANFDSSHLDFLPQTKKAERPYSF